MNYFEPKIQTYNCYFCLTDRSKTTEILTMCSTDVS